MPHTALYMGCLDGHMAGVHRLGCTAALLGLDRPPQIWNANTNLASGDCIVQIDWIDERREL